jgi:hypothetical protein
MGKANRLREAADNQNGGHGFDDALGRNSHRLPVELIFQI